MTDDQTNPFAALIERRIVTVSQTVNDLEKLTNCTISFYVADSHGHGRLTFRPRRSFRPHQWIGSNQRKPPVSAVG